MNTPTRDEVQAWIVSRLAEELGLAPTDLDVREPLASYGLDSVKAVGLAGDLEEWLGRTLSPTLVYEHPTVEALARHLASDGPGGALCADVAAGSAATAEPIAIVGMGCRFPGAHGPEAFWRLLRDGVDAIREVPPERWDLHAFYDPDPSVPGKAATRWGGFLERVDEFDARFFGISPREAARIDPQQRLLLEVAWEALEDGGQVPERLRGTATGVFVGISTNDYGRLQFADPARIDAYAGTGNALSIAANRLSYFFDFRGPSVAVDTACSSSLAAIHLACQSLRAGDCTVALAGGVNVILSPALAINFTKAGAMAPDGRCKAFDARANGYVRSEGAGLVVLKPLARAQVDGDPIYAVIRGSAMNQDGRTNGLMAPNRQAQEAVLREAYRRAGVSPGRVQYVEAHGTGTFLGDPIEAAALATILGEGRPGGQRCVVGSVKANVGHLEAAAGVAGFIKVALALAHGAIPPSLHFIEPNPHIPFETLPLRVPVALEPWPEASGPPLGGVSSFGFGGTNVHVVLEGVPRADDRPAPPEQGRSARAHLLPLSGRSEAALTALAENYRDLARQSIAGGAGWLADVCYTASVRRSHHDYRLAVAAASTEELVEHLDAVVRGRTHPAPGGRRLAAGRRRKVVFVFPGTGSQWLGMGRQLLEQEPVFREVIERCEAAMRQHVDWSLGEELTAEPSRSRLDDIAVFQPALFAVEIALTTLWRSWSIEPDAVIGHSMGEVTAAYVADALGLEDAVRTICRRSQVLQRTSGRGAMLATELSFDEAARVLAGHEGEVSIAASNSPASTVLSGDLAALEVIAAGLQRQNVFCRFLRVDVASHSPHMDPLRAEVLDVLAGLTPRPGSIPIYSTVTAQATDGREFDAAYWTRNVREPVLFSRAIQRLLDDGHDVFVEVSAHPVLLPAIQECLHHGGRDGVVLPSLRRGEPERLSLLRSLGGLYAAGHPVDWRRLYPTDGRYLPLPSYPWQRERHWLEPGQDAPRAEPSSSAASSHPLLGRHVESAHPSVSDVWEVVLDRRRVPWLEQHRVQGAAVLPVSAYVDIALAAAARLGAGPHTVAELVLRRALFLPEGEGPTAQLVVTPGEDGEPRVHLYSRQTGEGWTGHATGRIGPDRNEGAFPRRIDLDAVRAECPAELAGVDFYAALGARGVAYGAGLRLVERLWRGGGVALAVLRADAERELVPLLEACFQTLVAVVGSDEDANAFYLPTSVAQVRVRQPRPGRLWAHARRHAAAALERDTVVGEVWLVDEAGEAVAEVRGVRFERISPERGRPDDEADWLYDLQWHVRTRSAAAHTSPETRSAGPGTWLIFADDGGVGEALAARFADNDEPVLLVARGIEPEERIRRFLDGAPERSGAGCRGIIYLWSLDSPPPGDSSAKNLDEVARANCGGALAIVRQLAKAGRLGATRLWLVTRGAQVREDDAAAPALHQAPLWGLGRVIAAEHRSVWGGLIDLDPELPAAEQAAALLEEIRTGDGEDQVMLRRRERYVARLGRRMRSETRMAQRWRRDGSYLIAGGLGDLGLAVARWMAQCGARRLVLLARTPVPPRAAWGQASAGSRLGRQIAAIREIEALGASVQHATVDVGDESQVGAFLETFQGEGWPPIRGVVHVAGVLEDRLLLELDEASLSAVFRAKVVGAWVLHRLLRDASLDFFILFSSAASLLGQPGQGGYAAANAFLDALAHYRRVEGRPALSVNWGPWADLGFATTPGGRRVTQHLARLGVRAVDPARAFKVLERLLQDRATNAVALPVSWPDYRQAAGQGAERPLLSLLVGRDTCVREADGQSRGRLREALLAADHAERPRLLQEALAERLALILGLAPTRLDHHQPLTGLGLDSLMAVQLKNWLEGELEVTVPVVTFLQGPSLADLGRQILDQLRRPMAAAAVPMANPDRLLAVIDRLSDEQVEALLGAMLNRQDPAE